MAKEIIDLAEEAARPVRAFLVGATDIPGAVSPHLDPLKELRGLVDTLGLAVSGEYVIRRRDPAPRYGIGTGKAGEIFTLAEEVESDSIIFDFELSPTHQRNWEKLAGIPVFDRHEVILRIFDQRAQTKEAALQVELARLEYSLPRLAHSYGDMARQRGGSYGAKGSGETQLELDRRAVETKMARIKIELEKVVKERETLRKRRDKIPLPVCALVGYTNAGKSSLLNALTGSEVFVENRLFATLDPTTRRLNLPNGAGLLLTDTVGFISNLPHSLVNAFHSTLEEAARANLLLIVLDSTDPAVFSQYETVLSVLKEIGADTTNALIVLNKVDALESAQDGETLQSEGTFRQAQGAAGALEGTTDEGAFLANRLKAEFPEAIQVSAKTRQGFGDLTKAVCAAILGETVRYHIPLAARELVDQTRKYGVVQEELWEDEYIDLTAQVSGKTAALLDPYRANPA